MCLATVQIHYLVQSWYQFCLPFPCNRWSLVLYLTSLLPRWIYLKSAVVGIHTWLPQSPCMILASYHWKYLSIVLHALLIHPLLCQSTYYRCQHNLKILFQDEEDLPSSLLRVILVYLNITQLTLICRESTLLYSRDCVSPCIHLLNHTLLTDL